MLSGAGYFGRLPIEFAMESDAHFRDADHWVLLNDDVAAALRTLLADGKVDK